jgi:hypothetical protein
MNDIVTLDASTNYAVMAKAIGIATESSAVERKSNSLARLRIHHTPLMGQAEVKGKMVNMEVVAAGTYKLEIPDGPTYYAPKAIIRPFLQRFMYKRFIKGQGDQPNRYVKSVMADNLNIDLKDNAGTFNCGKAAGYIADFKALPEKMQDLIKQIKRVRVVLGTVELIGATDELGNAVDVESTPFIWEIDNRDAFKTVGEVFARYTKLRLLLPHHKIKSTTEERKLPNGGSFFLPLTTLDVTTTFDISTEDQNTFADFMGWVTNYNTYIMTMWKQNSTKDDDDDVDVDTVNDFIDIDSEVA